MFPREMLMHDSEGKPVSIEEDLKVESIFNEMLEQVKTEMASRPGKTDQSLGVVLEQLAGKHELFKQPAFNPIPIEQQVVTLWALQKDYYAQTDIAKVTAAAASIREFFATRKDALLTKVRETGKLTDEIEAELKTACDEWAATQG